MMRCKARGALLGGAVAVALLLGGARASAWPWDGMDGDRRTGYPREISCLAAPSDTGSYIGYYVGGGAPCRGDAPCAGEGTWGWDYSGCVFHRRVALGWWHGRRYQGGIGSYSTAGTKCRSNSTP
jgi:hypothetical protein